MTASYRPSDLGSSPGKAMAILLGSLVAFVLLLLVLEQAGVEDEVTGGALMIFIAGVFVVLGITSRTVNARQFECADRAIHPLQNGMAIAANWISIGIFTGLGGSIYAFGFDGALPALGWMGGLALMAIVLATHYRRSGAVTVADFLGSRTGSALVRFLATLLVIVCCGGLLVIQISAASTVAAYFLDVERETVIAVSALAIALCTIPGGMRSTSWSQIAQFIILAAAFLTPAIWITVREAGGLLPHFATEGLSALIEGLETGLIQQGLADPGGITETSAIHDRLNRAGLVLTIAAGIAVMPHLLMRVGTVRTASAARWSAFWGLVFVGILAAAAPVYSAFARLEIYRTLPGMAAGDIATQASWVFEAARLSLFAPLEICGSPIEQVGDAVAACGGPQHLLTTADIALEPGNLIQAFSSIADLPFVIHALTIGGILAAALSTATGLAMALAMSIGGDLYFRVVDRNATANRRLLITRLLLLAIIAAACWVTLGDPALLPESALFALPLAAAGLFPAVVAAALWKNVTATGIAAGMIVGGGATALYLWGTVIGFGGEPWPTWPIPGLSASGIQPMASGLIGLPLGFLIIVTVSLLANRPALADQDRSRPA